MPRGRRKATAGKTNGGDRQVPIGDNGAIPTNRSYAPSSAIERGTAGKLSADLVGGGEGAKREPCICGCGLTPSSPTALFMPGHDSRVRSLGKQILDGQAKKSDLTPGAKKYLDEGGFWEGRMSH